MVAIHEIEKELISSLKFPKEEVLIDENEKKERQKTLEKALSLGNLDKVKVKIVFEDAEATKMVYTTIWAITDKNVLLKADRKIPIHRIRTIDFV